MAKKYNYSFAIGKWELRDQLDNYPAGEADHNGIKVDGYGRIICAGMDPVPPPLQIVEDRGDVIYMKYANAAAIIIITVTE